MRFFPIEQLKELSFLIFISTFSSFICSLLCLCLSLFWAPSSPHFSFIQLVLLLQIPLPSTCLPTSSLLLLLPLVLLFCPVLCSFRLFVCRTVWFVWLFAVGLSRLVPEAEMQCSAEGEGEGNEAGWSREGRKSKPQATKCKANEKKAVNFRIEHSWFLPFVYKST